MLCQACGQRDATIKLVKVVNGLRTVEYICDQCAREQNKLPFDYNAQSFSQLLAGLFNSDSVPSPAIEQADEDLKCSQCGMTWSRFKSDSRVGCATCYTDFRSQLLPLIRRLHGHVEHRGHVPHKLEGTLSRERKIKALKLQLQEALVDERYEDAAEIRDQIKVIMDSAGDQHVQ